MTSTPLPRAPRSAPAAARPSATPPGAARVGRGTALRHEHRTWAVAAVSAAAAALLLAGGVAWRSSAVVAEGLHSLAHVAAFLLAGAAYRIARRLEAAGRPRAARLAPDAAGALNGAVLLLLAAELAWVSTQRLLRPQPVDFAPSIALAGFGLLVSLVSAALLSHSHAHEHGHAADVNFRGVHTHVLSDVAVAGLAILGLLLVQGAGLAWADAASGLAGAALVAVFGARLAATGLAAIRSDRTGS